MTQREEMFDFFDALQNLKDGVNKSIKSYDKDDDDGYDDYDEEDDDDGYDEKALLTKKQAETIIEVYEENPDLNFGTLVPKLLETHLATEFVFNDYRNEINALINPLTRTWALENFVEKDKRYMLRTEDSYDGGIFWYVAKPDSNVPFTTNPVFAYVEAKEELEYWKSDAFEYVEV